MNSTSSVWRLFRGLLLTAALIIYSSPTFAPPRPGPHPEPPRPTDTRQHEIGHETNVGSRIDREELQRQITEQKLVSEDKTKYEKLSEAAQSALKSATGGRTAALDKDLPWLQIRLADDPSYDEAILRAAWYKLSPDLFSPLGKQDVSTVSLITDLATTEAYLSDIPTQSRKDDGVLGEFLKGIVPLSEVGLSEALAPMAGQFLVVIGHIDQASQSFEFERSDGTKVRTPISLLDRVAHRLKVNFLAAGCKSASLAAIGTTTDVLSTDVVHGLATFFRSGGDQIDMKTFFSMVTASGFTLSIDLLTFDLFGEIDVKKDGRSVEKFYWRPSAQQSPVPPPRWVTERLQREADFTLGFYQTIAVLSCLAWGASLVAGLTHSDDSEGGDIWLHLMTAIFMSGMFMVSVHSAKGGGTGIFAPIVMVFFGALYFVMRKKTSRLNASRLLGLAIFPLLLILAENGAVAWLLAMTARHW